MRVAASGIPWHILEAARNATAEAAAGSSPLGESELAAGRVDEEASASTCRWPGADALRCSTHRCSALVVGNANYTRGALPAATRQDAEDVAATLEKLGFGVSRLLDGTKKQMKNAAKAFFKSVDSGGISLLYFIGHGFQLDGANHLLPVDYPIDQGAKAAEKAVAVSWLLQTLGKRKAAVNLIILDACHPSPFRAKAVAEGLAPMVAPLHSLIALPAAPGAVRWLPASAPEAPSLYTRRLLEQLAEPHLQVEEVFKRLRKQIANETGGRQVPWESTSLVADFVPVTREASAAQPLPRTGEL